MDASRVYIVASKFAPHAGGTAVVWTHWCKHWPADQIEVVAPKIAGAREFDRDRAYRIIRCGYPDIPKIRMPWLWVHQALTVMTLCAQKRPKALHLSHVFENGFLGPILKRTLGIPYFVHTYGEELQFALRFAPLRHLVAQVLREAAGVTTISRYTEGLHVSFGYRRSALMVHPGVDIQRYRPAPATGLLSSKFGVPEGPVLLTTGRLMERKGHDRVLRIMPRLLGAFPDLSYVIAGVGPHRQALEDLSQSQGVSPRVHWLGRVTDEDLPQLMREATLFVHPNYVTPRGDIEGFGIVFLEAAASGLPVVGGRSGGVPDSVDEGVNGLLVGDSEEELLAVTTRILADEALRLKMAAAGPEWAKKFSWRDAALSVWDFMELTLAPGGRVNR